MADWPIVRRMPVLDNTETQLYSHTLRFHDRMETVTYFTL